MVTILWVTGIILVLPTAYVVVLTINDIVKVRREHIARRFV